MTYVFTVEDRSGSPNFGKEIASPVTIIDAPPMHVAALRAYLKDGSGLKTFSEAWAASLPKDLERIKGTPKESKPDEILGKIEKDIERIVEFRVLATTQPRLSGVS